MKNKRMLIKFISSLLLGVFSLNAKAVCSTSDIAGTWKVFGGTTSADFHGYARGKLVFSSDGSLLTESSTLRSSGSTVVNFSSGQVNVSSSCKVTGSFFTTVDVTILLTDGQMDVNKSVVMGVYRRSDGDLGLVNLVKR